jgi:multicomponent Na+:H+ antiporter subunit G
MTAWISDALILLGLAVMTVGVYGVLRLPDVYTQLHAASKAAFLGVAVLLGAATIGGGWAIAAKSLLIVVLLAITTPVAAHVIGHAAHRRDEPMETPGAVDER